MKKIILILPFLLVRPCAPQQQPPEGFPFALPSPEEIAAFEEMIKKATEEAAAEQAQKSAEDETKKAQSQAPAVQPPDKTTIEPKKSLKLEESEEEPTPAPDAKTQGPQSDEQMFKKAEPSKEKKAPETLKYSEQEIGVQGNWRKKVLRLREALDKNDALQKASAEAQQFKPKYYEKFKTVDTQLDTFYRISGFEKEKLDTLFQGIEKYLDKTQKKVKKLFSVTLSDVEGIIKKEAEQIRKQHTDMFSIEEEFKTKRNSLDQLKADIKIIQDLDAALRERLKILDLHLENARAEADNAQTLSKKIWYVIDDLKAKDIYYKINTMCENVKNIKQYVTVELFNDFESMLGKTKEHIDSTNTNIKKLEDYGIFVKNRTERVEQERKRQVDILKQEKLAEALAEKKKKEQEQSWFTKIWEKIKSIIPFV